MYFGMYFGAFLSAYFGMYPSAFPKLNRAIFPRADKRHLVHPLVQNTVRNFHPARCFFHGMKLVKTAGQNA